MPSPKRSRLGGRKLTLRRLALRLRGSTYGGKLPRWLRSQGPDRAGCRQVPALLVAAVRSPFLIQLLRKQASWEPQPSQKALAVYCQYGH